MPNSPKLQRVGTARMNYELFNASSFKSICSLVKEINLKLVISIVLNEIANMKYFIQFKNSFYN
jgi:hypothetical protein